MDKLEVNKPAMDLRQVVKLLELMESHGLDELEIEQGETRIRLRKGGTAAITTPVIAAPIQVTPNGAGAGPNNDGAAASADKSVTEKEDDTFQFTSPMVGTFYRASSPDADPFVSEGDHVTADHVVCIIEAMKVMNEIKADAEGEVVRFLVENGESVEYGQPLVLIRRTKPAQ